MKSEILIANALAAVLNLAEELGVDVVGLGDELFLAEKWDEEAGTTRTFQVGRHRLTGGALHWSVVSDER